MTFSLAVYAITINKRRMKDLEVLSDFGPSGNNFMEDIINMIDSWKKDPHEDNAEIPIKKDTDKKHQRAYRIGVKTDGSYIIDTAGLIYLKGIIEAGEYGTIEPIIDTDTGMKAFQKNQSHALLKPFYFMFYIPKDSKFGFLILERIGQDGIFTILTNAIKDYCKDLSEYPEYNIKILPVALQPLIDMRMKALKYEAKKISLMKVVSKDLKISKISDNDIEDKDTEISLTYKWKNLKQDVSKFVESVSKKRNNENTFYVINEDLKCDAITITIDVEGKEKTLSLGDYTSLGFSMDVTDDIQIGDDGYPTFDSIEKQADILVSYIKDQFVNSDEE